MTPVKFILRYTAVPLMAIVAVVFWASLHSSVEIDARQYAALSVAYASFPVDLRRDVADAMKSGKLSKWDYSSLVRQSLDDGIVLDWPPEDEAGVAGERHWDVALVVVGRRPADRGTRAQAVAPAGAVARRAGAGRTAARAAPTEDGYSHPALCAVSGSLKMHAAHGLRLVAGRLPFGQ